MDADALLGKLLLHMLRDTSLTIEGHNDDATYAHLCECPEAIVTGGDGGTGSYGCDTGCEYVRLTCQVSCPHYPGPFEASYGDFGDLAGLIDDMERQSQR